MPCCIGDVYGTEGVLADRKRVVRFSAPSMDVRSPGWMGGEREMGEREILAFRLVFDARV